MKLIIFFSFIITIGYSQSNSTLLNPPLTPTEDFYIFNTFTSDGEYYVGGIGELIKDANNDVVINKNTLYSVHLSSNTAAKLFDNIPAAGNPNNWKICPDNLTVYAIVIENNISSIYSNSIDGGQLTKLNIDVPIGGRISNIEVSPNGEFLLYQIITGGEGPINTIQFKLYKYEIDCGPIAFGVPIPAFNEWTIIIFMLMLLVVNIVMLKKTQVKLD